MNPDVLIVGGGPAGAAAALTFCKYSALRPLLLDLGRAGEWRLGETIGPGVLPLLQYLGLRDAFESDGHLPAYATVSAWKSAELTYRDSVFTGYGNGWHLDRARFDRMLLNAVDRAGGMVVRNTTFTGCERDAHGMWNVGIMSPGCDRSQRRVQARFIIDASGRSARVARELGSRVRYDDRMIATVGLFCAPTPGTDTTFIETSPAGWWYSARVPGNRIVVALMTDAVEFRRSGPRRSEEWSRALLQTEHVAGRVPAREQLIQLATRPVDSCVIDPIAGNGWLAAGDAAATFDPIGGMGIGHAIASGIHAARSALAELTGSSALRRQYAVWIRANFHEYVARRRLLYAGARRWPESGFWSRRMQVSSHWDDADVSGTESLSRFSGVT